jgi:hypothetical protein
MLGTLFRLNLTISFEVHVYGIPHGMISFWAIAVLALCTDVIMIIELHFLTLYRLFEI